MSKTIVDDVSDESEKSEGSDADSESSSKSTIVAVNVSKGDVIDPSPQLPTDAPEREEKSPGGDKPDGDTLRQSRLARLRSFFQEVQDSENSSDYEKTFTRYDFSDAESASSTDLETSPRAKLLSDYSLEYITKRHTCDRDYTETSRSSRTKDRRKVAGKRRETYRFQTECKPKYLSYLTNKTQVQRLENKSKPDTNLSDKTSGNDVVAEDCPGETVDEAKSLKPVWSTTLVAAEKETGSEPSISLDLRNYKKRTRIPIPAQNGKRDMEGILKAADDQYNSLDCGTPFYPEGLIVFETDGFDKTHTLEVIEESCYETTAAKEDASDETLSDGRRETREANVADEEVHEETSDVSLDRSEYTLELIEEALRDVSGQQSQLEPVEEEQPFMIENRTLRNLVNAEPSEGKVHGNKIISRGRDEASSAAVQGTEPEKQLEEICENEELTTGCDSQARKMLRVSLAKVALMKYAAQVRTTVKHDDQEPAGSKSVSRIYQSAIYPDSGANRCAGQESIRTGDAEKEVAVPLPRFSAETEKTDHHHHQDQDQKDVVCGERDATVLSNMISNIPLGSLSLDDRCVVANISAQQYTLYIQVKDKGDEGSPEGSGKAQLLRDETPKTTTLKRVTCADSKRGDASAGKVSRKVEAGENKNCRPISKHRDEVALPRVKKAKSVVNVARSNKQRFNHELPVIPERSCVGSVAIGDGGANGKEVKRKLNKKVVEGRHKRGFVPMQTLHESPSKPVTKNLKSWFAAGQKRHQSPANVVPSRKGPRLGPRQSFVDKAVRETRASLLRKAKDRSRAEESQHKKDAKHAKSAAHRRQVKKGTRTVQSAKSVGQPPRRENSKSEVKEKPKAKIGPISPGFERQCLDFIQPEVWQVNDTPKFAYFCAPAYDAAKFNVSKRQPKCDAVSSNSRRSSPRANEAARPPKKVYDCVATPVRTATSKETARSERVLAARRKAKEYQGRHRAQNPSKSSSIQRRAVSKEETKTSIPESNRYASTRSCSVDFGHLSRFPTPDLGSVWSKVSVTDGDIRQQLEQESILDKEAIAKNALENVFKNLNSYLVALESSSDSSLKTCPALHFKHTVAGDAVSSEDDTREDLFDDDDDFDDVCGSDSGALTLGRETRLERVKLRIRREPLVSDLKWSLLVAACHGYNFDKYLTPFPEHFVVNGRKDIEALLRATEQVPPLPLLCNLSASEVSPAAVQLLHWLLVELSGVKVVATSTREAAGSLPSCPDAAFSVWQRPSTLLDRRLRSNGRGLPKVEAFCCARLDKFHALLHGGMVPSGVMRRDVKVALELAKPGYGYGCSLLGAKIKCVARCQVIVHPRLVELTKDEATVRGRNLVRVQQLLVFREPEDQEGCLPQWPHVAKIVLVVLGLYVAAFGLLWTFTVWEEPLAEPVSKRPDYSEAFPWLASL